MERASAEEWARRVERWRDSGLTAKEFSAETGLNAGTLLHWSWKLRAAAGETRARRARTSREPVSDIQPEAAPRFVELPAASLVSPAAMLELVVGELRVPAGFDEDTLGRVLRAVGACR